MWERAHAHPLLLIDLYPAFLIYRYSNYSPLLLVSENVVLDGLIAFLHPAAPCVTFSCWTVGIVYNFLLF